MSRYDFSDSQDPEARATAERAINACRDQVVDRLGAVVHMIDLAPMDAYKFPELVNEEDRRLLNQARDQVAEVRRRLRMRR